MANQAAKKASKAKKEASKTYKPILLVINALYIYGYVLRRWEDYSSQWTNVLGSIVMVGLTWFSYVSILEASSMATRSSKAASWGDSNSDALAGGISLDLLGLVVIVQMGTAFVSCKFYWLLSIIPTYLAYKGFGWLKTYMGWGEGSGDYGTDEVHDNEATNARREARRQKRRQKWS